MPVDPNKELVACAYTSDDGNVYSIGMRRSHATAIGATIDASHPSYPRGYKPRHIGLIGDDGIQRAKLIVPTAGAAAFVDSVFGCNIIGTGSFAKTGSTGEKRPLKYKTV